MKLLVGLCILCIGSFIACTLDSDTSSNGSSAYTQPDETDDSKFREGDEVEPDPHDAIPLLAGETIPDLEGEKNDEKLYYFDAVALKELNFKLAGGPGDADMYIRFATPPTQDEWDYRPYNTGNNETVIVNMPNDGRWYVMLHAFKKYEGANFQVAIKTLGPCDTKPCQELHKNKCVNDGSDSFHCECNYLYIENEEGVCILDGEPKEWTILVFLNADNNLESYGYGDLDEMALAGSDDNINVVVLFDSFSADNGATRKIYIHEGEQEVMEDMGELDLGNWQTLADFGIWGVQNFPSEHYALVIWDHGDGWRNAEEPASSRGISYDDHGNGSDGILISNGDYAAALHDITQTLGKNLDIVGLDACLMGMWEVAEASAPYADYLIASEETEPARGWAYDDFLKPLKENPSMDAAELGMWIAKSYYEEAPDDETLSVVSLERTANLSATLSVFADQLMTHADQYEAIHQARNQTQNFYYSDNIDLKDFALNVLEQENMSSELLVAAQAVADEVDLSVTYNAAQGGSANAHGIAIYFPTGKVHELYDDPGAIWCEHSTWDEFIKDFTNTP